MGTFKTQVGIVDVENVPQLLRGKYDGIKLAWLKAEFTAVRGIKKATGVKARPGSLNPAVSGILNFIVPTNFNSVCFLLNLHYLICQLLF